MVMDFDEQAPMAMLEELGQLGVDIAAVERPWRNSRSMVMVGSGSGGR